MVPPLAAVALQNAIMFGVYNNAIRLFPKAQDHLHSALQVAFAGGLAGLAQLWIITPTDLVKIKLQMQTECKCYTCMNGYQNYKNKAGFLFGELAYTWNSSASFQMSIYTPSGSDGSSGSQVMSDRQMEKNLQVANITSCILPL